MSSDAERLFDLGRFARKGTYLSPLYVTGPARLATAQWTGILPPGFPEGVFRIEVLGFADEAGTVPRGAPFLAAGRSGQVADLSALGPVRSFRYRMTIDATGVPGPLFDTPFFESIRFQYQRPGEARFVTYATE